MAKPKGGAIVRKRQEAFLTAFSKNHGNVLRACLACGISREAERLWRNNDPEYAKRFAEVKLELVETLEDAAADDALGEWSEEKRRFVKGDPILKMFLLKKHDPSYRDNIKLDHTSGGMTLKHLLLGLGKEE